MLHGALKHIVRGLACALLFVSGASQLAAQDAGGGKVRVEWLGHEFYRFTSPKGVVIITSPWLGNPDGPVPLESLARTDVILVPNAHNDDMGNPVEIAAPSGAMVLAPGPLGRYLIDKGLKQEQFRRAGIGDMFTIKGVRFKIAPSSHDNTLPTGADGGPSAAFFVTFENGFTIFYNGHSTLVGDLPTYAELYQPDLAILGLAQDPPEFAAVARMMSANNPKLKTIYPSHMRPDAPIVAEGRQALAKYGLDKLLVVPELRKPVEF